MQIQQVYEDLDLNEYADFIEQSLNHSEIFQNSSFGELKSGNFQGHPTKESFFHGEYMGHSYWGKFFVFNLSNVAYLVLFQGEEAFAHSKLLRSILNSFSIRGSQTDRIGLVKSIVPKDWKTVKIENIGTISIPPTMELRDDNSFVALVADRARDALAPKIRIQMKKSKLIFQPKGQNKMIKGSFDEYSRILINVTNDVSGDYYSQRSDLSEEEIQTLNDYYLSEISTGMKAFHAKIVRWYPFEVRKINGKGAFRIAYIRQLGNSKPVSVQEYVFFNHGKKIDITLSYRQTEKDKWEKDFSNVINTFRLSTKNN
ncbi:hypothetical protein SD074_17100 [Prolixibacter sp. SD074]|nr:hypothetical protein SD074_17100 [Prolixibacter sp. SD074]